jgi:hypothetical protein
MSQTAEADVGALGVLAHDEEVELLRLHALERTEVLGVELDRTQVDVQVEAEADARDDRALQVPRLDPRIPDRAEKDRVVILHLAQSGVGKSLPRLQVVLGTVGISFSSVGEPGDGGNGLENAKRLPDDLFANPIAG